MASGEDARGIPPCISTICHPDRLHKHVTCILCDVSYCNSDFCRLVDKGKGFFITNSLMVCSKHNLQYNQSHVSDIANKDFDNKHILNLKMKLIQLELDDLKKSKDHNTNRDSTDKSITIKSIHDVVSTCEEVNKHNQELSKYNSELIDNNKFLRNLLEKQNQSTIASFSSMVKKNPVAVTKPFVHVPKIIITPKVQNSDADTYNKVTKIIKKCNNIKINKLITEKKNKSISVCCAIKADIDCMKKNLSDSLSEDFDIQVQSLRKPIMKVFDIDSSMSVEEIEHDINKRNFSSFDDKCKVIRSFKIKDSQCAILELTSNLYEYIRNNDNNVYVGSNRCKAQDDILSLCSRCGGFNHGFKKCNHEEKCIKCAGNHTIHSCNADLVKCHHCTSYNTKFGKTRSADHMAWEVDKCETLKSKYNYIIGTTDYPVLPEIPTALWYQKKIR